MTPETKKILDNRALLTASTHKQLEGMLLKCEQNPKLVEMMEQRIHPDSIDLFDQVVAAASELHEEFHDVWNRGGYPELPADKKEAIDSYFEGIAHVMAAVEKFAEKVRGLGVFAAVTYDFAVEASTQMAMAAAIISAETGEKTLSKGLLDKLGELADRGCFTSAEDALDTTLG